MKSALLAVGFCFPLAVSATTVGADPVTIAGVCAGYKLAITPAGSGNLVITNGVCPTVKGTASKQWYTFTLIGFCLNKKYDATRNAAGNLTINCK